MYEAVGPFFPFVRYAAFMLVIRSLLAKPPYFCKNMWQFLEDTYAARSFHPVRVSCQDTVFFLLTHMEDLVCGL